MKQARNPIREQRQGRPTSVTSANTSSGGRSSTSATTRSSVVANSPAEFLTTNLAARARALGTKGLSTTLSYDSTVSLDSPAGNLTPVIKYLSPSRSRRLVYCSTNEVLFTLNDLTIQWIPTAIPIIKKFAEMTELFLVTQINNDDQEMVKKIER
jgi:hypothetical protein